VSRFTVIVIMLMGLSFSLVPFNTVHAHVDDHHGHSQLHGGHVHDLEQEEEGHDLSGSAHYVPASLVAIDKAPNGTFAQWVPVVWFVSGMTLGLPAIGEVFRPPGDDPPLLDSLSWQRPPLRGPPLLSI
jgi:hypothetical protein